MTTELSAAASALGKRGTAKRWAGHLPERVFIGDLKPEARELIMAAVRAEREKRDREKAGAA